jgi:thioredoxin-related protein
MIKSALWCALLASAMFAGPIQDDPTFKEAVRQIAQDDKTVLMIYTTDSCPECAYMKRKVFHDKEVEPYLRRHFVVIEKNVHKEKLPDGFDFFGLPTMFFIDKTGHRKETLIGSKRPPEFLNELRRIQGIK